jgi:ankyrin repeat protein
VPIWKPSRGTSSSPRRRARCTAPPAAQNRDVCVVLLDAGADPNARQHGGFTPLLEAAQSRDADLAELLLAHGADSSLALEDGRTAAQLAAEAGDDDLAARLR